jgi:hypothetical protein
MQFCFIFKIFILGFIFDVKPVDSLRFPDSYRLFMPKLIRAWGGKHSQFSWVEFIFLCLESTLTKGHTGMDMVENVLQKVIENSKINKQDEARKKVLADSRNMFEIRM